MVDILSFHGLIKGNEQHTRPHPSIIRSLILLFPGGHFKNIMHINYVIQNALIRLNITSYVVTNDHARTTGGVDGTFRMDLRLLFWGSFSLWYRNRGPFDKDD